MSHTLHYHTFENYTGCGGTIFPCLKVSYEIFGMPLHTAPIVLVHHALTGNSDVISPEKGWWRDLVGDGKLVDTKRYTVIAFNVPGNGYDNNFIENYKSFTLKDAAILFYKVLQNIGVKKVFASIGGSVGGAVAWQLAALTKGFIEYIIPIATDWKATAWVLAYCTAQAEILEHSSKPLHDARIMAMLLYRTPQSLEMKFGRTKTVRGQFNIDSWLKHHGKKLEGRFDLNAYKMMNHLITTIAVAEEENFEEMAKEITSTVVQIAIDTDLFFVKEENIKTAKILTKLGVANQYHEVKSQHGHDGFLIEHEQITNFLETIFK